jgi:hypothetical protein
MFKKIVLRQLKKDIFVCDIKCVTSYNRSFKPFIYLMSVLKQV